MNTKYYQFLKYHLFRIIIFYFQIVLFYFAGNLILAIPAMSAFVQDPQNILYFFYKNPFNLAFWVATPGILITIIFIEIFSSLVSFLIRRKKLFLNYNKYFKKLFKHKEHRILKYIYWYFRWVVVWIIVYLLVLSGLNWLAMPLDWVMHWDQIKFTDEITKFSISFIESLKLMPKNVQLVLFLSLIFFTPYLLLLGLFLLVVKLWNFIKNNIINRHKIK